eukprot:GEMP01051571.1.p1 GENE.GEMP01051571.1~~GEMP01051571.1.p1  ORF type:complete len:166 (+),score=15.04 GEMP01051571.1:64-561(+)
MFGVLVAGQLVQTEGKVVGDNQIVFTLPHLTPKSIAVFLTGLRPMDPNTAASIYLVGGSDWAFLGCINNQKPSAIFRIRDLQPGEWRIGIQVESELQASQRLSDKSVQGDATELQAFTEKLCLNLYNYLASFDTTCSGMIPINILERWFKGIEEKLRRDPQFWRR